jgi:hypothetical protein
MWHEWGRRGTFIGYRTYTFDCILVVLGSALEGGAGYPDIKLPESLQTSFKIVAFKRYYACYSLARFQCTSRPAIQLHVVQVLRRPLSIKHQVNGQYRSIKLVPICYKSLHLI